MFLMNHLSPKGKIQEKVRKSTSEMTKLDKKGATDKLASMRGVDIVGANNNLQEGKRLLNLPPGNLICDNLRIITLVKNLVYRVGIH